jgi:hypothetical protein
MRDVFGHPDSVSADEEAPGRSLDERAPGQVSKTRIVS